MLNDIVEKIKIEKNITKQDILSLTFTPIMAGKIGKAELLIKHLMKKFKKLPNGYKEKVKSLPKETIELIATDIFELNSIEELEQYF